MRGRILLAVAVLGAWIGGVRADGIWNPNSSGAGLDLTINSSPVSGATAGQLLYSDGTTLQASPITTDASGDLTVPGTVAVPSGPLDVGIGGNWGKIVLGNTTSGSIQISPPSTGALGSSVATLPINTGTIAELNLAQTWTAAQTFANSDIILLGSSTGGTTFTSANANGGNYTITIPAVTDTMAGLALANGGTNASLTASNGGIFYSTATAFALLAGTATAGQCLLSGSSAAPTWGSCSGAAAVSSVSNANGTLTISPMTGAVVASLALGHPNTWTAAQTFTNSDLLLLGSSTGYTTFTSANAGASNFTLTFPAANDTVADLADIQTFTNKTIAFASNTLTGVAPLASPTFSGTVTFPDTGTWSSTGAIINAAGSVSAPSLAFTKYETGTGFYAAAAGEFALAINGTARFDYGIGASGAFTLNASSGLRITNSGSTGIAIIALTGTLALRNSATIISSPATATLHLGAVDAASPVAQTLGAQGVIAGNANTAAANFTITGGLSNGSGGGDLIFATTLSSAASGTQNTAAAALTLKGGTQQANFAGQINVAAMTQTAVAQTGTVCYNSGTGAITYDATLGCLSSTMDVKDGWRDIEPDDALGIVARLHPGRFTYKVGMGLPSGNQVGFSAQQVAQVDDSLVGYRPDGSLGGVRYQQTSALYAGAITALLARIEELERRVH